ncbi:fimbrial protein [Serratia marcescens]|uniref:fimbrial protein n=1 Tax=Serratia marcescens TaxID=615 RepID=UPI0036D40977
MKNIVRGLLLACSGLTFSVSGADGSVDLEMRLVHGTCNLTADSKNMQVLLGNISRTELASIGAVSKPVSFTIKGTDCVPDMVTWFRFDGTTGEQDSFALNEESEAKGVGVQLLEDDGIQAKRPNTDSGYGTYSRDNGTFSQSYQVQYIALSDKVTPGTANVTTQLNLVYR